ncbi:hypothetical protein BGZ83_004516 [Gryganskiella cystojenkinii]|nr:hypothetical protein BGZ83_004516 [Gryganskiella cystojenkinii]
MSDSQAELLRKRREARQKKILASGESRLSKITGTSGTNAQVAPTPSVLQAREQLLKKEQEEERIKAAVASGELLEGEVPAAGKEEDHDGSGSTSTASAAAAAPRISRQASTSSTHHASAASSTGSKSTAPTVEDSNDADPDDSLGAPQAHTNPFASPFGNADPAFNPFLNNPFLDPQQQHSLTRRMQSEDGSKNTSSAMSGFGAGMPPPSPGFTVLTPTVDTTARWWKLLHFVFSVLLGFGVVYREYSRQGDLGRFDALATDKPLPYGVYQVAPMPVFWYFVTMELILQSTRMFLHGVTASPSSTLGTIAGFLPPPFSDMIRIFMRYRLIWSSLVSDLSVVVFIVGLTVVFTHMFS